MIDILNKQNWMDGWTVHPEVLSNLLNNLYEDTLKNVAKQNIL